MNWAVRIPRPAGEGYRRSVTMSKKKPKVKDFSEPLPGGAARSESMNTPPLPAAAQGAPPQEQDCHTVVREITLAPEDFTKANGMPLRRLEDPATLAKLGHGAYYKGGRPAVAVGAVRPGVRYGVSPISELN